MKFKKFKAFADIRVNKVVRHFIISDLFFVAGWGFINPVLAVFIIDKITGATIETVGLAAAVYWILKAIFQMPIGMYLDKNEGEKDDFYTLVMGLVLASVTAFLFVFIDKIWQLFALEALHALAFAFYSPAWNSIFSRHIDRDHYAFDWSLDSTTVALAAGVSGALGGWIAQSFGFDAIFVCASILTMIAAIVTFLSPDIVFPKPPSRQPFPPQDHRPHIFGS
ncbi:MAG: MFS transporter [Candidatus Jorgensenbacteria bacterium]